MENATEVNSLITKEHKNFINKQIMKALKEVDYEEIVQNYIDSLLEETLSSVDAEDQFNALLFKAITKLFVDKGLISPESKKNKKRNDSLDDYIDSEKEEDTDDETRSY